MDPEIIRAACTFAKVDAEAKLLREDYRDALNRQENLKKRLSAALYEAKFHEAIAIALDDSEVLVCVSDGEGDYDFSLIRSYS